MATGLCEEPVRLAAGLGRSIYLFTDTLIERIIEKNAAHAGGIHVLADPDNRGDRWQFPLAAPLVHHVVADARFVPHAAMEVLQLGIEQAWT
ncbi:hypothetical protein [Paraburkholderia sp. BCC1884]|uniref:hypothetical protein n=1 Tax=Paraburkholderia sp. BCC1884 TaxID=2562668 RepID=UPI001182BCA3|nr:hypothetical protein [Paraburkholderia sp. BCC1884]